MSVMIGNTETFQDLTIYTQGIEDWDVGFWSEFKFSDDECSGEW